MKNESTFGERLKALRVKRNMSQEEFASLLDTSKQVISRYETNQRVPKITVVQEYAQKLSEPIDYLLTGDLYSIKQDDSSIAKEENGNYLASNSNAKFNIKDDRDIALTMEAILNQLDNQDALMFDGEPLDNDSRELLKASLENSVRTAKLLAKQKFTPTKYKK